MCVYRRLIVKIDVQPGDRLKTMNDMIKSAESKEQAPCGGFTMMYQCMCDYHGLPFRDEVAWVSKGSSYFFCCFRKIFFHGLIHYI